MANISSIGLGSGIDADTIIKQLVAVEKQPITAVEDQNTKLNTKLSTWGRIQSGFSALKDAAANLGKTDFWNATTAQSSDEAAVSVTAGPTAATGSYNVVVKNLAQSQYLASNAYASKTEVVGEGTLRIELGTFVDNPTAPPAATFAAKAAATAVDIDIGPGDNTLEKIRDKINAANAGVTASLVTDASGSRLVLRGSTGAENAFRITATESGDDGDNATGLSSLAYDPSQDIVNANVTQKAANAKATINGVEVTSASNTMTDVLDGLTVKLGKVSAPDTSVELTVSQDTASIRKGIDTFKSAYNDVVGLIRVQTLYDEESKTGGPLQGDSTAVGLLRQLRGLASGFTSASGQFGRLSDIGLEMGKDGTFTVNEKKMSAATSNLGELKKFFATVNDTDTSQEGIASRFQKMASLVSDSDGSIASRTTGLKGAIKRNADKIDRLEQRTTLIEARLRAQYTALDQSMTKLNGLSAYVTQQLAALNNSSS